MPATFYFEKNDIFEPFAEDGDGPFESNTRLLVFAASVGFARNRRVESPGEEGEIRWNYISQNKRLSSIVAALAYADHDDPEAILDPEMQIETLRQYGAGGARILEEEILNSTGSNLDNLITFIKATQDQDQITEQVGILEEIESEISGLPAAED
jgi:dnd system-associated protein 4